MKRARRRVWFSPCPGVGLRAVVLGKWGPFTRLLYRDLPGRSGVRKCGVLFQWFSRNCLIDRDPSPRPAHLSQRMVPA